MKIWRDVKNIFNLSLYLSDCRICGQVLAEKDEAVVCERCISTITPAKGQSCRRCDRLLPDNQTTLCGHCLLNPPPFKQHLSYGLYEGVLRETIILFKYGEILALKRPLSGWLMEMTSRRTQDTFDFILPVPADPGRKRRANHIHILAQQLAKELKLSMANGCLVKIRSTEPQVGLTMKKREANLKGAFALKRGGQFKGTRVLLVDDVFTTGTTIGRCGKLLTKAGAEVVAITLAKSRF